MKIKHKLPPNYDEIIKHIPAVEALSNVVFTYGNVLYVPSGQDVPPDLMRHEEKHQEQQQYLGIDEWWKRYLDDKNFRFDVELEAYRAQYAYIQENYNRQGRRQILPRLAMDLSSPLYGNLTSKREASELITK